MVEDGRPGGRAQVREKQREKQRKGWMKGMWKEKRMKGEIEGERNEFEEKIRNKKTTGVEARKGSAKSGKLNNQTR